MGVNTLVSMTEHLANKKRQFNDNVLQSTSYVIKHSEGTLQIKHNLHLPCLKGSFINFILEFNSFLLKM